jgi:arylsulfatase A-like enzyme
VLFSTAVSAAPFTTPSHASLFTGLWVAGHRAHHQYKSPIAPDAPTLAERLRDAGYRTAQSAGRSAGEGVMFASDATGLKRGVETSIYAGSVDRATKKWLKKARGSSGFLFFHTFAAHWPYGRRPRDVEGLFAEAWSTDDWSAVRRLYVENAREADRAVGDLLETLDEMGELERTVVVALADHGEGLNHLTPLHGPINGGREEVIRVPLVVRAPWAARRGARVDAQVRTVAVLPSLLELAGIGPRDESIPLAGSSLAALLRGDDDPAAERPAYFAGHLNDDPLEAPLLSGVRTTRWKLILDACTDEKLSRFDERLARQAGTALKADLRGRLLHEMHEAAEPVKLFDLVDDPFETRNVAAEHPDVVATLAESVARAGTAGGPARSDDGDDDAMLEEQLRALGYLT